MFASPEVLDSLRVDLALEHAAIMQYVIHGVALRDSALADAVKRVSREEMWHLEWLVEMIRARGGEAALDRGDVFVSASLIESLRKDVDTEQMALDHYARTLELVGDSDPDLAELIGRIMADEQHHRAIFARLADKVGAAGEQAFVATPAIAPPDIPVAGATVAAEYMSVLQYLWNKYGCADCQQAEQYFELAVDEMRHAGWAAGYLAGMGAAPAPPVPVDRVRAVNSTAEALEAAVAVEGFAQPFYAAKISEAANPDLRDDLQRAADQHAHHRWRLSNMPDA